MQSIKEQRVLSALNSQKKKIIEICGGNLSWRVNFSLLYDSKEKKKFEILLPNL
jgi:hypothetical protein